MAVHSYLPETDGTAFDIGWDHARFGKRLDAGSGTPKMLEGYRAGLVQFPNPQHRPDRFSAKWLQLRVSAYRRGRIVQADVTPESIKFIDVPVCPVALTSLTHSARADSDWSIDRINNDGAYASWNLMVVSSKVNSAKGTKDFDSVAKIVHGGQPHDGLPLRQWERLLTLMVGAYHPASSAPRLPLLTKLPAGSIAPLYLLLQHMALTCVRNASMRNQLAKALNRHQPHPTQKKLLLICFERLALCVKDAVYSYDAFADLQVQRLLRAWFESLPNDAAPALVALSSLFGAAQFDRGALGSWSLETRGYVRPDRNS